MEVSSFDKNRVLLSGSGIIGLSPGSGRIVAISSPALDSRFREELSFLQNCLRAVWLLLSFSGNSHWRAYLRMGRET